MFESVVVYCKGGCNWVERLRCGGVVFCWAARNIYSASVGKDPCLKRAVRDGNRVISRQKRIGLVVTVGNWKQTEALAWK